MRYRRHIVELALSILLSGISIFSTAHGAVSPVTNRLLGSCLTHDWVASVETANKINATARDGQGRHQFPWLHAAKKTPTTTLNDPRTKASGAFAPGCIPGGATLFGAGIEVDPNSGVISHPGTVSGAVVLEINAWASHWLTSLVFSILAAEVLGFPVAHYHAPSTTWTAQRMSSVRSGSCTPVHLNAEVWTAGKEDELRMYANETFAMAVGYVGTSGIYTTKDFVNDFRNSTLRPKPLFPGYWMSYRYEEEVINAVPVSGLWNKSQHFPPAEIGCADGTLGCRNNCAKTAACTAREAAGKECMVVVMMYASYTPGYYQAVLANLGVPTYMCFLGETGVEAFAAEAQKNRVPVVFYHYGPTTFMTGHEDLYERIFLPWATPERSRIATGRFGENGYGNATNNPVDVDLPTIRLMKFAPTFIQGNHLLSKLISAFTIEDLDISSLLRLQSAIVAADATEKDPTFRAACKWVQENALTWSTWIERHPLCTLEEHVNYTVTGCEEPAAVGRTIAFAWLEPQAGDALQPNNCDGGLTVLPRALRTSRSCEWIEANVGRWRNWLSSKPECDASFYTYNVTDCDADAKRTVQFWWLLPDPGSTSSLECSGGVSLPPAVRIDCDYMPTTSASFTGIAVLAGILIALQSVAILGVFVFREKPIIKRSQYEFLILLLVGGIIVCVAAILYAGRPSMGLCAARRIFISLGFTTVFGSLFVKSLRVYRVFTKTALKRVTVTMWMMFKLFGLFLVVDVLILTTWFLVDFPEPTVTMSPTPGFSGDVDRIQCKSTSFMFTAILIFWKAILLFSGLYISFLVRNVSADFQESIWIFAASVIVLVSCLFILPLAYMIEMAAAAFYMFLAVALIVSTAVVMSMMLVPKFARLNYEVKSAGSSAARTASLSINKYHKDDAQRHTGTSNSTAMGNSRVGPADT